MYNLNERFATLTDEEMTSIDGGYDPVGLFSLCYALGYALGKIAKHYWG